LPQNLALPPNTPSLTKFVAAECSKKIEGSCVKERGIVRPILGDYLLHAPSFVVGLSYG